MPEQHNLFISIIIPCFNEEQVIRHTYQRVTQAMNSFTHGGYELVFINDGSRDSTLLILKELAQNDIHVKILGFSRNFGHQPAVTAGIQACTGDVAIIIDADLQDPPELFPAMVQKHIDEKANVVYGMREKRKGETFFKKITARAFYRTINFLSDTPLPVDTGDFRLIDKHVIEAFKSLPEKNKYIRGLITWVGFKQVPIMYVREERFAGETKYPLSKMIKFASTSLLYFSKKPLKLALGLGSLSILVGILLAIWVISGLIYRPNTIVPGWSSTVIAVIFFGGVQLLTIGVLGEYLGNMFEEIKNRPEYIIHEKINFTNLP
ncbi:glycosyltransferase [Flectobacillus major]|jgi:dolichol-phosphate mannosyltransferase|uniref:glycosyltransferase n=1 Tax=Flectobacillus major TaxID=103 RepID=UPI00041B0DDD|nr:glycosyltransferase [Flectobacillus major]